MEGGFHELPSEPPRNPRKGRSIFIAFGILVVSTVGFLCFLWPVVPAIDIAVNPSGDLGNPHLQLTLDNPNFFAASYQIAAYAYADGRMFMFKIDSGDGSIPARSATTVNLQEVGMRQLNFEKYAPSTVKIVYSSSVNIPFLPSHVENMITCDMGSSHMGSEIAFENCSTPMLNSLHPLHSFRLNPKSWYMIVSYVLVGILLLVAICLLFWPVAPEINFENINLEGLDGNLKMEDSIIPTVIGDVNMSLGLGIRNRNFFGVSYEKVTTHIAYRGYQMGQAEVKGGEIPGRGTVKLNVAVDLRGLEILWKSTQLLADVAYGELPLNTTTIFSGNLLLGFLKPPVKGAVDYDLVVNPKTNEILKQTYGLKAA